MENLREYYSSVMSVEDHLPNSILLRILIWCAILDKSLIAEERSKMIQFAIDNGANKYSPMTGREETILKELGFIVQNFPDIESMRKKLASTTLLITKKSNIIIDNKIICELNKTKSSETKNILNEIIAESVETLRKKNSAKKIQSFWIFHDMPPLVSY